MPLESGTYIDDLNIENPVGATDSISQGDNHLRLIKSVLKGTFPDASKPFFFKTVKASKSEDYLIQETDNNACIPVDTSSGDLTINLLNTGSLDNGFSVTFIKTDAGVNSVTKSNSVTIVSFEGQLIGTESSFKLNKQGDYVTLVNEGTKWFIVSSNTKSGAPKWIAASGTLNIIDEFENRVIGALGDLVINLPPPETLGNGFTFFIYTSFFLVDIVSARGESFPERNGATTLFPNRRTFIRVSCTGQEFITDINLDLGIRSVFEDKFPQLGGHLSLGNYSISNAGFSFVHLDYEELNHNSLIIRHTLIRNALGNSVAVFGSAFFDMVLNEGVYPNTGIIRFTKIRTGTRVDTSADLPENTLMIGGQMHPTQHRNRNEIRLNANKVLITRARLGFEKLNSNENTDFGTGDYNLIIENSVNFSMLESEHQERSGPLNKLETGGVGQVLVSKPHTYIIGVNALEDERGNIPTWVNVDEVLPEGLQLFNDNLTLTPNFVTTLYAGRVDGDLQSSGAAGFFNARSGVASFFSREAGLLTPDNSNVIAIVQAARLVRGLVAIEVLNIELNLIGGIEIDGVSFDLTEDVIGEPSIFTNLLNVNRYTYNPASHFTFGSEYTIKLLKSDGEYLPWGKKQIALSSSVEIDSANVVGPSFSINGGVPVYSGNTGKILKTSNLFVGGEDNSGLVSIVPFGLVSTNLKLTAFKLSGSSSLVYVEIRDPKFTFTGVSLHSAPSILYLDGGGVIKRISGGTSGQVLSIDSQENSVEWVDAAEDFTLSSTLTELENHVTIAGQFDFSTFTVGDGDTYRGFINARGRVLVDTGTSVETFREAGTLVQDNVAVIAIYQSADSGTRFEIEGVRLATSGGFMIRAGTTGDFTSHDLTFVGSEQSNFVADLMINRYSEFGFESFIVGNSYQIKLKKEDGTFLNFGIEKVTLDKDVRIASDNLTNLNTVNENSVDYFAGGVTGSPVEDEDGEVITLYGDASNTSQVAVTGSGNLRLRTKRNADDYGSWIRSVTDKDTYSTDLILINAFVVVSGFHGHGAVPSQIWAELVCVAPVAGYAIGDVYAVEYLSTGSSINMGLLADDEIVRLHATFSHATIIRKNITFSNITLDTTASRANWKLKLYARK